MTETQLRFILDQLIGFGLVGAAQVRSIFRRFREGELTAGQIDGLRAALDVARREARLDNAGVVNLDERGQLAATALWVLAAAAGAGAVRAGLVDRARPAVSSAATRVVQASSAGPFGSRGLGVSMGLLNRSLLGAPSSGLAVGGVGLGDLALPAGRDARRELSKSMLGAFNVEGRRLGAELARAPSSAGAWLDSSRLLVRDFHVAQGVLGAGRPLTFAERVELDRTVRSEMRYLARFAEDAATRDVRGLNPMTEKAAGARLASYGGEAYGGFYRANEAGLGAGWIVDYVAVDTGETTCPPCADAQALGPYLPGLGPMPGSVCRGGGFCRCAREARFDPARAVELGDAQAALLAA